MTDNIRPEHYRTGKSDLYEAWYQTYPFEQYRAIMQAIAERYMRRDKNDRVEDLDKAIYTLQRLKENEIERAEKYEEVTTKDGTVLVKSDDDMKCQKNIDILKFFLELGFKYLARDSDGDLWMHKFRPLKRKFFWYDNTIEVGISERLNNNLFPEIQWEDVEPTKISKLLESYENGGENGK